jgi:hypothetical protein
VGWLALSFILTLFNLLRDTEASRQEHQLNRRNGCRFKKLILIHDREIFASNIPNKAY